MMNSSLRKAAILVAALDPAAADELLDQMGPQQAAQVRSAVMELDAVEPSEQDAVLAEFFGRDEAVPCAEGVELNLSATQPPSSARPRFSFLHDAACSELAGRLSHEHPQLLAVVTSHLPAAKAAELLGQLPGVLREEVIDRLLELDDADHEAVAELEQTLERIFAGLPRRSTRFGPRHDHVQEILGHIRRKSWGQVSSVEQPQVATTASPTDMHYETAIAAQPMMPFEQLMSLDDDDFQAVFDEADPRIVMLALAGAPRRLFERYLAQFSPERALEFERHVEQLRPLRLRDVETAQQELATVAGRRLQAATTAAESSRRFAAAA
jgi:flagellar motor switch protein FliG